MFIIESCLGGVCDELGGCIGLEVEGLGLEMSFIVDDEEEMLYGDLGFFFSFSKEEV